jgi:putative exosortase-associated protein (TIGR04073 family)
MMISHKIAGFSVLVAGLLFAAAPALAGDYATDSGAKFTRGLANTATGWGEIPKNISNESRDQNAFVGATYGTAKGTAHAIGRTAVGVFDLVTFFVPTDEYVHSTYVWNDTGNETSYGVQ